MNKFLALITLTLSFSALAQEKVELTAEKLSISAPSAIVVRTNKTPATVELTFSVPMDKSICVRHDTRLVSRTSGVDCGYNVVERRIPAGRVCTRVNPHNQECLRYEETYRIERHQEPRTCMVPETYCAEYGRTTVIEKDAMKVQFKNLPALADSESETFSIVASQKGFDSGKVLYEVKPLETLREYKVTQKKVLFIKTDTFVVEEK